MVAGRSLDRATPKRRGAPLGLLALAVAVAFAIGALLGHSGSQAASGSDSTEPTHSVAGVPLGYPHSAAGAAAAVAGYQRAFADPTILHPAVLRQRIDLVATPDYAATMFAANSPGERRIAAGPIGEGIAHGIQTLYVAVPIGYRVESYSPARARILTWGFTLLGNASAVEPGAYFGLTHTELAWQGGEWKIAATRGGFGPTPKIETKGGRLGGFDVLELARRLRSYGAMP